MTTTQPTPRVGDTIRTAEELDALPVGSGVEDRDGHLGLIDQEGMVRYTGGAVMTMEHVAERFGPLEILYLRYVWASVDEDTVDRAAPEVRLDRLIGMFRVGSGDWSWREEHDRLWAQPWQATLTERIAADGIREPILLGPDGRVWDGHHRICAAMHLGLDTVPVEWAGAHHDGEVRA